MKDYHKPLRCGILEWNASVLSCFHDNMAAGQHFVGIMKTGKIHIPLVVLFY